MKTPEVAALAGMTPLGLDPGITITLTALQARAVRAAIGAEITKGAGTFLTPEGVAALGLVVEQIHRAGLSAAVAREFAPKEAV